MDDKDLLYKLWINTVCGHSPQTIDKFVRLGITREEAFDKNAYKDLFKKALGDKVYGKMRKRDLSEAKEILDYCRSNRIRIITIEDDDYPERLKYVTKPPRILYVKGENINLNNLLPITVVGSRNPTDYGEKFAYKLSYEMAEQGIITVSGMARGIDAAAHMGALDCGQKTVAVLAGGVDVVYPQENEDIYNRISENGMIISERPPHAVGRSGYYQERNRIIVGLSYGVVIVEGRVRTGTSITAGYAEDFSRDLFAVPGNPISKMSELPNGLLREGATLTTSAEDIVNEYEDVYPKLLENGKKLLKEYPAEYRNFDTEHENDTKNDINKPISKSNGDDDNKILEKPSFEEYNAQERMILEYLFSRGELTHIDEIINNTGLASPTVNSIMIMLQMKGAVRQSSGNLYILVM